MPCGSRIFDHDGNDSACTVCIPLYGRRTFELPDISTHGFAIRVLRENQVDNRHGVCFPGQNQTAYRAWLWAYALTAEGKLKGHALCISTLTMTDLKTLAKLRSSYLQHGVQSSSKYSAGIVLNDSRLLEKLICLDTALEKN